MSDQRTIFLSLDASSFLGLIEQRLELTFQVTHLTHPSIQILDLAPRHLDHMIAGSFPSITKRQNLRDVVELQT